MDFLTLLYHNLIYRAYFRCSLKHLYACYLRFSSLMCPLMLFVIWNRPLQCIDSFCSKSWEDDFDLWIFLLKPDTYSSQCDCCVRGESYCAFSLLLHVSQNLILWPTIAEANLVVENGFIQSPKFTYKYHHDALYQPSYSIWLLCDASQNAAIYLIFMVNIVCGVLRRCWCSSLT